jgi:hypothetical protein
MIAEVSQNEKRTLIRAKASFCVSPKCHATFKPRLNAGQATSQINFTAGSKGRLTLSMTEIDRDQRRPSAASGCLPRPRMSRKSPVSVQRPGARRRVRGRLVGRRRRGPRPNLPFGAACTLVACALQSRFFHRRARCGEPPASSCATVESACQAAHARWLGRPRCPRTEGQSHQTLVDSRRVDAFARNVPQGDIWLIRPDGTGLRKITHLAAGEIVTSLSWAPNGRFIAYTTISKDNPVSLRVVGVDDDFQDKVQGLEGLNPGRVAWSSDGRYLALGSSQGSSELWVMENFLPKGK